MSHKVLLAQEQLLSSGKSNSRKGENDGFWVITHLNLGQCCLFPQSIRMEGSPPFSLSLLPPFLQGKCYFLHAHSHTAQSKKTPAGEPTPLRGSKPPTSSKALWGDSARTPLQIVKAMQLKASQKQQECLCAEYILLPSLLPSLKITQEIQGGNSLAWLISPQTRESPSVIRTESGHERHLIISKIPTVSNSETSETFFPVNSDYSKN